MRTTVRNILIAVLILEGAACSSHDVSPAASGGKTAKGTATGTGTARTGHAAALLGDGRVLLAGGLVGGAASRSAQIFDPSTGQFTDTADLTVARVHATATVLRDGRVLVAGGDDGAGNALATTDLFDPTYNHGAGRFTAGGAMAGARTFHTATRVGDQVVVMGGLAGGSAVASVEVYTRAGGAAGSWASLAALGTARLHHTATLLPTGIILVAGGEDASGTAIADAAAAELYNPAGGAPTAVSMPGRTRHVAALLTTGDVLVAGGRDGSGRLSSWTIFDGSAFGTAQEAAPALTARVDATASVLPDGRVLVAGGDDGSAVDDTDVYAADGSAASSSGHLLAARGGHAATVLPSGRVLLTGGGLGSAELVDRAADAWTALSPAGYLSRTGHTATLLPGGTHAGQILVAAGRIPGRTAYDRSSQLYDPETRTLTSLPSLNNARAYHTATVLKDGSSVLVAGGNTGTGARSDAEVFDGTRWNLTGSMTVARAYHTATLLPNDKVLITGGEDHDGNDLASAEIFDPDAGTFTPTANGMSAARSHHAAALLPDGRVLVAGGDGDLTSADLYDPTTNAFTATGPLNTGRGDFTATPLAGGRVLAAGGLGGATELGSADLFDGSTGFSSLTGLTPRYDHAAALLPGGEVLFIGGAGASGDLASAERFEPASASFVSALVSPLHQQRHWFTATQLPTGEILAWGGEHLTTGTDPEQYDAVSTAALTGTRPDLSGSLTSGVPEGYLNLSTANFFTGGVGSDTRSTDVNQPVFVITRQDGDGIAFARTASFTDTTARVQLPRNAPAGWWWIRAVVGGVPGKALPFRMLDPFLIEPDTASVPPRGTVVFTARGGNKASYTWAVTTPASHDDADAPALPAVSATGEYQAGANPGLTPVTDTVECADADGNTVAVDVTVGPRISVTPAGPWGVAPSQAITFHAAGGCDPATYPALCSGYTWSFVHNNSGGTLSSAGAYVAGPTGGRTDDLQVVDNLGNHLELSVTVTTPIVIHPTTAATWPLGSQSFTVSGGCDPDVYGADLCSGYTWRVVTPGSGAPTIDASGNYTAGRTGNSTDVVRVTDALGSYAEATVTVGPGVSLSPVDQTSPPRGSLDFTAAGGNGTFTGCAGGSCWSFLDNKSGGTIDAAGHYTAGPTPDVVDVIQVQDTLGNLASTSITIGPGVSVTPRDAGAYPGQGVTLTATGGSNTGFTWQLTTVNSEGGVVNAVGGTNTAVYTAGTRRGVVDMLLVTDSLGNTATVDVAVWPDWKPAGSGCSSAGGGNGGLWVLVLMALWLAGRALPRRTAGKAGAALALLLAAAGARAQTPPVSYSFIVDRFQPAGGAYDVLGVQSAQTAGHLQKTFRLTLNYASRPLVLNAPGMDRVALLKSQLAADLTGSVGIQDWAEVSLAIPYVFSQSREQDRFLPPEMRHSVASSGLGDPRLTPKARLLEWRKLRLGVSAPIGLPLGNKKAFLGHGGLSFSPTALIELDDLGPARVLLNAGAILRPERRFVDLTVGNAYTYGAGFEYPFAMAGDSRLTALATFAGEAGMKSSAASRPMELLAGARWNTPSGLEIAAGGGPGLGKGYGTPRYRVFVQLGYTTTATDRLREKEEEAKPEPPKPEEPKAEEPKPAEEPKAEPAPEPPKEEPKAEAPKAEEQKPAPAEPEEEVTIRIDSRVYFDFNKKDVKEEYKPMLRRLAKRILGDPRMHVVRIEGHADDLGPPDYNLWLSEERARSVKDFLEKSGVPRGRFAVLGFGKTKPTKPGRTSEDRAKNRRVEFSVQEY